MRGSEAMPVDPNRQAQLNKRLVRLIVFGSLVGLIAAWGVLITLKFSGPMPAHYTWPVIIVFPPMFYGWFAGNFVLMNRYPRHPLAVVFGMGFVFIAITIALFAFFTPGGLNGSKHLPWQ